MAETSFVTQEHTRPDTPMGAALIADGATFRVWAPQAREVHVLGECTAWAPGPGTSLQRVDGGHWLGFVRGARDRHAYKFWVVGDTGGGWKRDPHARELEWSSGNCILRSPDFPWHETGFVTPRYEDLVIYQLHVGAYHTPRWPAGGTFLDVAARLPYLADLGITALQLLPIQEFSSTFSLGYNGVDYFSPESDFAVVDADLAPYLASVNALLAMKGLAPYAASDLGGEMNQLKALVDLAHAHGLAVIFDVVYNHAGGGFGDQSLYFFDRQQGQDPPPVHFENSQYFGPRDHAGGLVFDFGKPEVRDFLIQNACFLLQDYRIDGLRYDQVSVIDHDGGPQGWRFCQDLSATVRYLRPGALQLAEYWNLDPWVVKPVAEGGAGFDSTLSNTLRIALRDVLREASFPGDRPLPMQRLGESLWPAGFDAAWRFVQGPENHDTVLRDPDEAKGREQRIPKLADPSNPRSWYARSRSRVAMGLTLTSPGIPMMFMGQEFLEDKQWSDNLERHPELRLFWPGLEASDPAMRDFLRCTRELIRLRWRLAALRSNGFRVIDAHEENRFLAFHRWVPGIGEDVVVIVALSDQPRYGYRVGFPHGGRWLEAFNSDVYDNWVNPGVVGNGGAVEALPVPMHGFEHSAEVALPPNSILIFCRQAG